MRGKKGGVACGDVVEIQPTESGQGVIENIMPRSALLYRSDAFREKLIAANITQVIIVVAAVPSFSEELINRCIAAAENQRIKVLIVLNKADLIQPTSTASNILSLYRELGYSLLQLSAKTDIEPLITPSARPSQRPGGPVRNGQIHSYQCAHPGGGARHLRYFRCA